MQALRCVLFFSLLLINIVLFREFTAPQLIKCCLKLQSFNSYFGSSFLDLLCFVNVFIATPTLLSVSLELSSFVID